MTEGGERLRRIFASLFVATATAQLGLGIIAPILPLYTKTFAASGLEIGIVFAAFSLSQALLGPFVGALSDRIGRKPLILAGLAGYAIVSLSYAFVTSLWQLGVLRLIQGGAAAMVTPIAQAYVGDLTPAGREGRYMNAFYASQFVGMGFGPLLGGVIGATLSYEAAFFAMGGLTILSFALVVLTVPTDATARERGAAPARRAVPLRDVLTNDAVKSMLVFFGTRGFWRQSFTTFYPIFAVAAFSASESSIGIVLSTYMFSEGLLQIPLGFLADRYPRVRQVVVGSVVAPLLLLALPFLHATWAAASLAFVIGGFSALGRAPLVAIRTELGRSYGMARLTGIQGSSFGVGQMLGPVISGGIVDGLGAAAVFPFASLVGGIGTIFVVLWLARWVRSDAQAQKMARAP